MSLYQHTRVPVVLVMFNRPDCTARVLEAIARAQPDRLLVIADGPRDDHPQDPSLCEATRALIDRVDWDCEVLTNFSDTNLGCRRRIATGLAWVFSVVETAIILEDDCLPDASFFPFCEELLDRFADHPGVQMVSGCNVVGAVVPDGSSYYFSRCYHIWGWATWRRAWSLYDLEMTRWPSARASGWLYEELPDHRMADIATMLFDAAYEERVSTWDFQWVFAGWSNHASAIVPAVNLVTNIGYGAAATHERDPTNLLANLPTTPMEFPLRHPAGIGPLEALDEAEWEMIYGELWDSRATSSSDSFIGRLRRLLPHRSWLHRERR